MSKKRISLYLVALVVCIVLCSCKPKETRVVSESLITQIKALGSEFSLRISPNGKRAAYIVKPGPYKSFVVIDNKQQKQYEAIYSDVIFSPDSMRVAYFAMTGNRMCVVVDGQEQNPYGFLYWPKSPWNPVFSPDSKRLAYVASWLENNEIQCCVIVDGKEGRRHILYRWNSIIFSPDSKRLAYVIGIDGDNRNCVVIDEQEGRQYDDIWSDVVFSPDSAHVAYVGQRDKKMCIVLDGKEGNKYDYVDDLVFSPNSNRLACTVGWFEDTKICVVVDEQEGRPFDGIDDLIFSPDSKRVAYIARTQVGENLTFHDFVIVDGDEKSHRDVMPNSLAFSPDSKNVTYIARKGDKEFIVNNGKEQNAYDIVTNPVFSPDAKHLAYRAVEGEKDFFVVVDGTEGKRYDDIRSIMFSPDGKRISYVATVKSGSDDWEEKELLVVEETEGRKYDLIYDSFLGGKIVFDSPHSFHYLAKKGDEIYLVEETIH